MRDHDTSAETRTLFLLGLSIDAHGQLHATLEQLATQQRVDVADWGELVNTLQRLAGAPPLRPVELSEEITATLERLTAWYAAQPPLDRLILSQLFLSRAGRNDVVPFGDVPQLTPFVTGPRLLEPDELLDLGRRLTEPQIERLALLVEQGEEDR